jgi:hypothetical protein
VVRLFVTSSLPPLYVNPIIKVDTDCVNSDALQFPF